MAKELKVTGMFLFAYALLVSFKVVLPCLANQRSLSLSVATIIIQCHFFSVSLSFTIIITHIHHHSLSPLIIITRYHHNSLPPTIVISHQYLPSSSPSSPSHTYYFLSTLMTDVTGNLPPSIRSLKFLIPAVILGRIKEGDVPKGLENFLCEYSPDILLPMSFMSQGPPE
jgi:hypothetical protein